MWRREDPELVAHFCKSMYVNGVLSWIGGFSMVIGVATKSLGFAAFAMGAVSLMMWSPKFISSVDDVRLKVLNRLAARSGSDHFGFVNISVRKNGGKPQTDTGAIWAKDRVLSFEGFRSSFAISHQPDEVILDNFGYPILTFVGVGGDWITVSLTGYTTSPLFSVQDALEVLGQSESGDRSDVDDLFKEPARIVPGHAFGKQAGRVVAPLLMATMAIPILKLNQDGYWYVAAVFYCFAAWILFSAAKAILILRERSRNPYGAEQAV
jgi:hypothetical protein